jgi:hypothetical protein
VPGRGSVSKLFIHFGMLCAALAFASWWTSHTILATTRTRRITEAHPDATVLLRYRQFVNGSISHVRPFCGRVISAGLLGSRALPAAELSTRGD